MLGRLGDYIGYLNLDVLAMRVGTAAYIAKETVAVNAKCACYDTAYQVDKAASKVKEVGKNASDKIKNKVDDMKEEMQKKKDAKTVVNAEKVQQEEQKAETVKDHFEKESAEENTEAKVEEKENTVKAEVVQTSEVAKESDVVVECEIKDSKPEPELKPGVVYGMDFEDCIIKEETTPEPEPEKEVKMFSRETPKHTIEGIKDLIKEEERKDSGKAKKKK